MTSPSPTVGNPRPGDLVAATVVGGFVSCEVLDQDGNPLLSTCNYRFSYYNRDGALLQRWSAYIYGIGFDRYSIRFTGGLTNIGDEDNDGVIDAEDNCPLDRNPDQADSDGNGLGNVCDNGDAGSFDADEIFDNVDNCPLVPNPGQEDLDGDGVGDACDDDIDGDVYLNYADNCPLVPNPGQEDQDGDGVGDACEDL